MIRPQYHFRKVGQDILIWDVKALLLLAETVPVIKHPLSEIREIDEPYWFSATSETATCRAVMAHAKQAEETDLSFPILLCPEGRIMDGMHRVMKALGLGHETVLARRLNCLPEPDFKNRKPDELPYD